MKSYRCFIQITCSFLLIAAMGTSQEGYAQNSVTFNCTGATQYWTVPNCVDTISVVVAGAKGGGWRGGNGATVTADIPVTPGEVLEINAGCQGSCPGGGAFTGGGAGPAASASGCNSAAANAGCEGGGGSDIRTTPYGMGDRLVVAAGGGGMGGGDTDAFAGSGGCLTGGNGNITYGVGATGGTQVAGGAGGPPWIPTGNFGGNAGLGFGGTGGSDPCYNVGPGGGGGGGYYGGGGGGSDCYQICPLGGGGGGGGSSLTPLGGSCSDGNNTGDGYVQINYDAPNTVDATITPAGPFCLSDAPVNLTAADPGGTWSGNGITDPNAGTFDPGVADTGSHTITYALAGTCLGDTATTVITVFSDSSDATITPAGPFCANDDTVTLTAADPGGTWSGNGIIDAYAGTFDPATAGVGSHTITYGISGNCGDTATTQIDILNAADATITPAGPFCIDEAPVNLTAADPGGAWSGNGITDANAGTFDPGVAGVGMHTITYAIDASCGDTATTDILVDDTADATITPAGPFCTNSDTVTLTAADRFGTWSGNGITDSYLGIFDPGVAGTGIHTITYAISGNCGDTATTQIEVNEAADPTITPAGPFCTNNDAIALTATDPGGTWSGNGITDPNAGTFDPGVAGEGIHTITYAFSGMCGDTATEEVTVYLTANADFLPLSTSGCAPLTVQFENPSEGGDTYYWDFGNGKISTATYPEVTYQNAGTYSVQLTASNPGCADTLQKNNLIVVFGSPEAAFQPRPDKTLINEQILFDDLSVDALMWQWDFGDGNSKNIQSPAYSYPDAGTYSVMLAVENDDGCRDTAYQTVVIVPDFDIGMPNAFTPNGDKLNDIFNPEGNLEGVRDFEMQIWNRWGELIFETTDKHKGWNGRRNNTGQQAVPDTYFYQLKITDFLEAEYTYSGYIYLIR